MAYQNNFYWGGATAANQYEGGFNEGGRGLTMSDFNTAGSVNSSRGITYKLPGSDEKHIKGMMDSLPEDAIPTIFDDEYYPNHKAADFYHRYKEDIKLLGEMGIKMFRMSISWSRIYSGISEKPNQEGLDFYRDIFLELRKYNIEPLVTISHYDTPLYIEHIGGWSNRETIDLFVQYCKTIFTEYKDLVKYWITFNEINSLGLFGETDESRKESVVPYQKLHNQFVAAAKAVVIGHEINTEYQIGCMIGGACSYPYTCSPKDVIVNMEFWQRNIYYTLDVMVRGEYPAFAKRIWTKLDGELNITEGDINILKKGKADFLSFSYYCSFVTTADKSVPNDAMGNLHMGPKNKYLKYSDWGWSLDPDGLRFFLNELYGRYQVPIMIVENGLGAKDKLEDNKSIHDQYRIDYLREHIKAIGDAIEDGVDVIALTTWGCVDLISGSTGEMSKRYGYIYVDCDDQGNGTYDRYKKDSFYWYKKVIETNGKDLD